MKTKRLSFYLKCIVSKRIVSWPLYRDTYRIVTALIYCRSIHTVSEIFLTCKDSLGAAAYFDKKNQADNILVEMYHKSTHQDSKERILAEFKSGSSRIRCIIATVALEMGLDIRDVQLVVKKRVVARDGRQG